MNNNNGPIRILFTIPNFITAGSGRAMLNIVENLDRKDFAPAVCVLKKGGNLDKEVEGLGIPLIEAQFTVEAFPRWSFFSRALKASKQFRDYRFQLWHSFHYRDDYTEALVAYLSGAKAWIYTKKNMSWYRGSWYLRTLLAARIGAQNHDMMKRFFANPFFRNKVTVIPTSVDLDLYHPEAPAKLNLRQQLNIPKDDPIVACVAQLVSVKNHALLLEASARIPNLHVFLAGAPFDREYTESLHQLVRDLQIESRVHFLGLVGDIPSLLAEIDIFVLPSRSGGRAEGCPVALLEAMSAEKCCIATDVPGSRDILSGNWGGWLVPPENTDALAAALKELSESKELRQKIGKEARRKICEKYRIEREVKQYIALYDSALQRRSFL
jgi:glycosyltransferase involved in cell wall biosynthesis